MISSDLSERNVSAKVDAVGIALTLLLVAALAFRITRGADLSDESYYALFIDDWLKGSIATSAFRTIHQTAALIVYPAAVLYAKAMGSSDGLFLFLRVLFLIGAVASSFFWTIFLKRLGHRIIAVPQHPWLWSSVDEEAYHQRRYSRGELEVKLRRCGFDVVFSSSFTTLLLPIMAASRFKTRLGRAKKQPGIEFAIAPRIHEMLTAILRMEIRMTLAGFNWPAGGSRIVVGRAI
jgi:hypothetical protein